MTWLNAIVGQKLSSKTNVSANVGFMPTGNPSVGALGINARRGKIVTFGGVWNTEVTAKLKLGAEINGAATTTGDTAHQLHVVSGGNYELRRSLHANAALWSSRRHHDHGAGVSGEGIDIRAWRAIADCPRATQAAAP
jgi:hypothetical protein